MDGNRDSQNKDNKRVSIRDLKCVSPFLEKTKQPSCTLVLYFSAIRNQHHAKR